MRPHRQRRATRQAPATPCRPEGSGDLGASAALAFLGDATHRLRQAALHLPPTRRNETHQTSTTAC